MTIHLWAISASALTWAIALCVVWMGLIFYLGSSRFGRTGTQSIIDRFSAYPKIQALLNRFHGTLRASFHYVEFVTLTVLLYWLFNGGAWEWRFGRGISAWALSCLYAYIDEWHQSRTPGRMFRRIDFLHSLAGATLALGLLRWVAG